jgi:hypothetical protein
MTKSQEEGRNEITEEAAREAKRTGKDVCAILKAMSRAARKAGDTKRQKKIQSAEKFLGCRDRKKRRSR